MELQPIPDRFRGKTVIVTGAASGIGAETARRFSAEGANVVLADRNGIALDDALGSYPAERTFARTVDISSADDFAALVEAAVERFGALDVLVNNAGVAIAGTVLETDPDAWATVMNINVSGIYNGSRAAMGHLVASKGCIVNTASVSGLGGDWGMAVYNTSKGAVVNLTRALAIDHGRDGVRVNAVCPTVVVTPMIGPLSSHETFVRRLHERIPMQRLAMPADVAAAILFLASDDARFISGALLPVDGGLSASSGQPDMRV